MSDKPAKILILFAHPSLDRSENNAQLKAVAELTEHVKVVDLYYEYPDYHIDINREQQRLVEHDVIIFMFPLYWYSTPSILKEWQDLVLEYGFAYGAEGKALEGKLFLCSITAGGASEAYEAEGYNHFTLRELLQPLEQTAYLTGMHYVPPLALFGSRTASEENRLKHHLRRWRLLLKLLVNRKLDPQKTAPLKNLNKMLDEMLEKNQS